jgi:hypothetical protein
MSEDAKNNRLRSPMSKEKFVAKLAGTLQAGGREEAPPAESKVGDKMPDGTVFAGISPETNKPMYATPTDASLTMTFNEAQKYAAKLDAHGHRDWRVPTKAELNVLFNNRAAIGGFNLSGPFPAGWYWSASSISKWISWGHRFSDGYQGPYAKGSHSAVRCVR